MIVCPQSDPNSIVHTSTFLSKYGHFWLKKKDNESHTVVFRAIVHKPMDDVRVGLHLELTFKNKKGICLNYDSEFSGNLLTISFTLF